MSLRSLYDFRAYESFGDVRCPMLVISARPPAPRRLEEEAHLRLKERGLERAREAIADLTAVWMDDTVHLTSRSSARRIWRRRSSRGRRNAGW